MTFKVRVVVTVPRSHELPDGRYLDREVTVPSKSWQQTIKKINALLEEAKQ